MTRDDAESHFDLSFIVEREPRIDRDADSLQSSS